MIKHVWFDLEETLTRRAPEFVRTWEEFRYKTYSEVVKKPLTDSLRQEYKKLLEIHKSNSGVFRSLGLPADFWHKAFAKLDKSEAYKTDGAINSKNQRSKRKI